MKFLFSAIFIFSTLSFALTKSDLQKKINFVEGKYQAVADEKNPSSEDVFCEPEILDIKLDEEKNDLAFIIGSKLIFPNINLEKNILDKDKKCHFIIKNKIEQNFILQTTVDECEKNNTKTHKLVFSKDKIEYVFSVNKKNLKCTYSLVSQTTQPPKK